MRPSPDILVLGAGAAGLWAAARAAERGARVTLLEKTPRAGTKVLASGGTRCNLTTTLGPDEAARLFGRRGERFLRRAFRALSPLAVREHFERWGVPTVEAPLEKVFPRSQRARDVRDALTRWAAEHGVETVCGARVATLERLDSKWTARLEDGGTHQASRLVLATGGKSYARTGTTGDGYPWLRELGLRVSQLVPALVPLRSPAGWVHALAGVALQDVEARLTDAEGRVLGRRARPVVFTHHGISGPGAMDLAEPVARAAQRAQRGEAAAPAFKLVLDLAPGVGREALRARLIGATGERGAPRLSRVLRDVLESAPARRVLAAVCRQAGVEQADPRPHELTRASRHALVEALKGLAVPVDDTLGFDRAEVTAGGLDLASVDPGTMRVRGCEGLYAIGEILDVAGPIGGLNFQSAFATAELAARDAAGARG